MPLLWPYARIGMLSRGRNNAKSMPSIRRICQARKNDFFEVSCRHSRIFAGQVTYFHGGMGCSTEAKRPLSAVPKSVNSWWKDSTLSLLDYDAHPVGSFDTLLWHKSETAILYWSEKRNNGLDICFRLLDRLAEECCANPDAQFEMSIYLIHAIIGSWKKEFQSFQSGILPSQILAKLDGCISTAPGLFRPNIATYSIILDGASYCPDPSERFNFVEKLLERLINTSKQQPDLRPSEVTIGTVLKAWSKGGSIHTAEKAEALLRRIIELTKSDDQWKDFEVNTIHYTTVLSAYANAGQPEPAQRLLREMFEEYLVRGNAKVRPNLYSFNSVLSAWSKSSSQSAFQSAEEIFIKMGELNKSGALEEAPDEISYNCLLKTLGNNVNSVSGALDKAESLVTDLLQRSTLDPTDDSIKPSLITFTAFFRILAASQHPEMAEKATYWLAKATEHGVSDERFLLDQYRTKLLSQTRNQTLFNRKY